MTNRIKKTTIITSFRAGKTAEAAERAQVFRKGTLRSRGKAKQKSFARLFNFMKKAGVSFKIVSAARLHIYSVFRRYT